MKRPAEGGSRELEDSKEKEVCTIAIYGTGSEKTEDDQEAVAMATAVGTELVRQGKRVATGGYGRVMRASSEAAAAEAQRMGIDPKERVLAFPFREDEKLSAQEVTEARITRSQTLPERLTHLVDESDGGYIIIGGGFGTTVELLTTLEARRIDSKLNPKKSARPVIIIDKSLKHTDLLAQLAPKERKLQDQTTMDQVYILNYEPAAAKLAAQIIEMYSSSEIDQETREALGQYSLGEFLRHKNEFEQGGGI